MYIKSIYDNKKNTGKGYLKNSDVKDKITDDKITDKDTDQTDNLDKDQKITEIDNKLDIDQYLTEIEKLKIEN